MTQVKEMTNHQLNRELAELMGWTVKEVPPGANGRELYLLVNPYGKGRWAEYSVESAFDHVPDYCTDPAASLEVQAAARKADAWKYVGNLYYLLCEKGRVSPVWSREDIAALLDAAPRDRAEAAYQTMQEADK